MEKRIPEKKQKVRSSLFEDERGALSAKRVLGFICGLTLCVTMIANSLFSSSITPSDTLVNAVLTLACVCLVSTSIDKFSNIVHKKPPTNDSVE